MKIESTEYVAHHNSGEKNPHAKLTENEVKEIKRLLPTHTVRWIAQKYGIHTSTIHQIARGLTWRHVKVDD